MLRGLYAAATALDAANNRQDVISQNIAHATVPGYRSRGLVFETFDQSLSQTTTGGGATTDIIGDRIAGGYSSYEAGPVVYTANPYDLALSGDGFFVINGPNGQLYTRNGSFQQDSQGILKTKEGFTVAGDITIPAETSKVSVGLDGSVYADNAQVGQLRIVRFDNPQALIPAGTTAYAVGGAQEQANDGTTTVYQGYIENSNVQIVSEMVNMIAGQRYYEAAQRAIRAISDALQQNTKSQGS
jgi:flagellar basal-body rod protein FlgF